MSKHVSQSRSVIFYHGYSTGDDDYLKLVKRFDLFCSCGIQIGLFYNGFYDLPQCPNCSKKPDVLLNDKLNSIGNSFVDYSKVWDNGHSTRLQIAFTSIFQRKDTGRMFFKKQRYSISFNSITKNIYLTYGNRLVNWSYGSYSNSLKDIIDKMLVLFDNDTKLRESFCDFLNLSFSKLNIQYTDTVEFSNKFLNKFSLREIRNAFCLLKFNYLQDFKTNPKLMYCDGLNSPIIRKKMREVDNLKDFYSHVLDIKTKKALKIISDSEFRFETLFLNQLVDDNNLEFFWEEFKKTFPPELITSSFKVALLDFWKLAPLTAEYALSKNLTLSYPEKSFLAFKMFRGFYSKDKPFIRSMLKNKKKIKQSILEKVSDDSYLLTTKDVYKDITWHIVQNTILDSYEMRESLHRYLPDVEVKFDGDIFKYHDDLARETRRINRNISDLLYSKEEKDFFNTHSNGIDFKLIDNSTELTNIGIKMNNCVANYLDEAVNRECYILCGYGNSTPVVCIEIVIHKGKLSVRQALGHSNAPLSKEYGETVSRYLSERGISVRSSADLKQFSSSVVPQFYEQPLVSPKDFIESIDMDKTESDEHSFDNSFDEFGRFCFSIEEFNSINGFNERYLTLSENDVRTYDLLDRVVISEKEILNSLHSNEEIYHFNPQINNPTFN